MGKIIMSNWSFKNANNWGKKYSSCKLTDNQSPINIDSKNVDPCYLLCLLELNYTQSSIYCRHSTNLITFYIDGANTIKYNEKDYNLKKISIHLPSLHTVDNNPYQMEINLYHSANKIGSDNVILSIFVSTEGNNTNSINEFTKLVRNIPVAVNSVNSNNTKWKIDNILP